MKPYLALFISLALLVIVWQLPYHSTMEEAEFYQQSVELSSAKNPVRIEGFTKIHNDKIIHIASFTNEAMTKPIIIRFKGNLESFSNSKFSIMGKINLLSIQEVRTLLNHSVLSPYLLLEDETVQINYTLLLKNEAFLIVHNHKTDRIALIAKR